MTDADHDTAAPETIVVIGGGQSAGWALKTLRKEGFAGRLVMIAEERHPPYERPPLSKAVLAGEADPSSVRLVAPDEFAALKIEACQPDAAVSIDCTRRTVSTAAGREIPYDRLILATGGSARRLPPQVVHTSHLAYLRTVDDAQTIGERLRAGRRVLVVGGGWIGLEVAATARKLGVEVTVIEGAARLCERSVPPDVSAFLLELHQSHGVDVRLNAMLASLHDDGDGVRADLADGTSIHADFAVAGIGLVPNTELAERAGLKVENGVAVNEFGATSDPYIYACGDAASHPNEWFGRRLRLESWANAQNQAISTAKAALGIEAAYAEIPWFWSDQYDVNLQILGETPLDAQPVVRGDLASRRATLFYVKDEMVRGVIAINNPRDLKLARKWMNQARKVDVTALADVGKALA